MKPVERSEVIVVLMHSIYDYIFGESLQNADFVVDTLYNLGEKLNIFPEKKKTKEPLYNFDIIRFFPKRN